MIKAIIMVIMLISTIFMVGTANGYVEETPVPTPVPTDEPREQGEFEIVETIGDVDLDLIVEYDAGVCEEYCDECDVTKTAYHGTEANYEWVEYTYEYCYNKYTPYEYCETFTRERLDYDKIPAEFDITGELTFDEDFEARAPNEFTPLSCEEGETTTVLAGIYNVDLDANGKIVLKDNDLHKAKLKNIDGKIYQIIPTEYLYKDGDARYYSYGEFGYNVEGNLMFKHRCDDTIKFRNHLTFSEYLKMMYYAVPYEVTSNSAPALGVGFMGSTVGDQMPILYTFKNLQGDSITSTEFPTAGTYKGGIIETPARVAGKSLQPGVFDTTPKGQRVAEWRANHAE